jgi:drug/metabolite transporter (DMT)-like permease
MEESLGLIFSAPFIVVAMVVFALSSTVRGTIARLRPGLEKSVIYKSVMPWAVLCLGIGAACAAKGVGQFDAPWGYVILLGCVAGFASSWIWGAAKQIIGAKIKNIGSGGSSDS